MIQPAEQIERWENVARVLDTMTDHERQKHFDMSVWGRITECGTVHCAAGRCGLDPWFRERGFKMDFTPDGDSRISNVQDFFGFEGSWEIFLDASTRPVERVIEEVTGYTNWLKEAAALQAQIATPALGEWWPDQGGFYAGLMRHTDGGRPYILLVSPAEIADNWNACMKWAAQSAFEGFTDSALPSRAQQRRLADTVPQLFERKAYWSREQHAAGSGCAWFQNFNDGTQGGWGKNGALRARAVRRSPI